MAGKDHKIASGRSRNTAAAIAAAAFILVFLVPSAAYSGYRVIIEGTPVETSCYWIQNSKFYLCETGSPIPLARISSVKEGTFTELESEMHRDAKRRFFVFLTWMMDRDQDVKERVLANLDLLEKIEDMRASSGKQEEIRRLVRKSLKQISSLKKDISYLQEQWAYVRVPERSWVIFGEIKSAQLLTEQMSLEERRLYLTTWDPTYLAYTVEHMEQAVSFDPSFSRVIQETFGSPEASSTAENASLEQ